MKSPTYDPLGRMAPRFVANFDSATAMVRALARFLRGKDFPRLGMLPPLPPLFDAVNRLPRRAQEQIYILGGWKEAIPPRRLGDVRWDALERWVAQAYPRRRYPAVALGSSNGAAVHLLAALGIPWLPQTFLIPVRRSGVHPDEMRHAMEWARLPARALLQANPDLQLHHMHDPSQDRLMIHHMAYFRVKTRALGETYARFLRERLEPGGTLLLIDCDFDWPTTQVDERHYFQPGAYGGISAEEYLGGDGIVSEFLAREGSHRARWDPPPPDGMQPEAEWGFERALEEDVARVAVKHGYRVRRLSFREPVDLSPLVADLYREWQRARRRPANRLVADSFILLDPWWTLRTGAVPYWTPFAVEPAVANLEAYLDAADPYDTIHAMLFSNGLSSIRLTPPARWDAVFARAKLGGGFLGVDETVFPRDFATFIHYQDGFRKEIPARYPIPGPLTLEDVETFLVESRGRYAVSLDDGRSPFAN